jgi:hypothetical protein
VLGVQMRKAKVVLAEMLDLLRKHPAALRTVRLHLLEMAQVAQQDEEIIMHMASRPTFQIKMDIAPANPDELNA